MRHLKQFESEDFDSGFQGEEIDEAKGNHMSLDGLMDAAHEIHRESGEIAKEFTKIGHALKDQHVPIDIFLEMLENEVLYDYQQDWPDIIRSEGKHGWDELKEIIRLLDLEQAKKTLEMVRKIKTKA